MKDKNAVLFVDDEINVLSSLRRSLQDEEFRCFFSSSGEEALEIMSKEEISVIVTDMRMPGMNGLTLLKIVKEKYPTTVRIVLSGYTQLQQVLATINQVDIFQFITKPWSLEEEFIPIIYQAIDYYNIQIERIELRKSLEVRNVAYQNIFNTIQSKQDIDSGNFENIRQICLFLLSLLYMNPSIDENTYVKISMIFIKYMQIYPIRIQDISIENLFDEVKAYAAGLNNNNEFYENNKEVFIRRFVGDINKLVFVTNALIYFITNSDEVYNIEINNLNVNQETQKVKFVLSIENKSNRGFFDYKNSNIMKDVIYKILDILDISFEIKKKNDKIVCEIEGVF